MDRRLEILLGREWMRPDNPPAPRRPDPLFLRGVHEWERREAQRFVVDIDGWLDNRVAADEDQIEAAVCRQRLQAGGAFSIISLSRSRPLLTALALRSALCPFWRST